ncbi:MAG TPA: ERF family protein [Xanthobacteraceae bacterium]|nr:ERF family protein [Xanthobacteraceae bacterium]
MNQVATIESNAGALAPPPVSEAHAFLAMIERAARDPATDMVKFDRLLDMRDRVEAREAKRAYVEDFALMQPNLPTIGESGVIKNKSGEVQSTYAKWSDINEALRPILAAHHFALSFRSKDEPGFVIVTAILSHRGGHSEETTLRLPLDQSGAKNSVQAAGSSISYGKRYTSGLLLNFTSRLEGDDDTDGVAPSALVTPEDVSALEALIAEAGANKGRFLKFLKVDNLESLPSDRFSQACAALRDKIKTDAQKAAA